MDKRVQFPNPELYGDWRRWANEGLGSMFMRLLSPTPTDQIPIVLVREEQTSGTAGGAFNSGSWVTRTLNVKLADPAGIGRLSSNKLRVPKGRYLLRASAPGHSVDGHVIRIYDVTNSVELLRGTAELAASGAQTRSQVASTVQFTTEVELRLEHRCVTTKATDGLGKPTSLGTEVYAEMELWGLL